MASSAAFLRWPYGLGLSALAGLAALALTQSVRSGAALSSSPPTLVVQEPIARAHARLQAEGWAANPERQPLPFERERAGNQLASLSGCSGTGMGFCRYDYKRGRQGLAVVTVPGADREGLVHSWFALD